MTELAELYSKGIKRKLKNYWAAWLPRTQYRIGDIGTLNGYVFEKVTSLEELGIRYYVHTDRDPSSLDMLSESGIAISFKAQGETNPGFTYLGSVDAGVKVEFTSKGAFVLQAPETFESEFGDPLHLQNQVKRAYVAERWEKDWVLISRLIATPSATVLISKSSNACLELVANANLSGLVAALGSADARISVKHQQGDTLNLIGGPKTPLFQLSRLKTPIFGRPKFETKSFRASDPSLADLTPDRARDDRSVRDSLVLEPVEDEELVLE